jgi:hypothetical protein
MNQRGDGSGIKSTQALNYSKKYFFLDFHGIAPFLFGSGETSIRNDMAANFLV